MRERVLVHSDEGGMCKGGGTLRSTSHHLTLRIRPLFQLQGGEVYGWMNFGTCLLQVSFIVPRASRGNLDRTLDRCLVFSFLLFFCINTLARTTSGRWKDWNGSMVRRRVEWNGSINSRECLLSSRGGIPPGRGRERRKGIKTIDRELVPGRRFSLARASCGTRERRREGRRSLEKRKKERKEERKKEKRRNGRSNNTVHKDSAERLVPAINTNTIAITTTTGVISFSFSSRSRRGIGGGEPLTKRCVFLEAGWSVAVHAYRLSSARWIKSRSWTTFGITSAQRREQRLYSEHESWWMWPLGPGSSRYIYTRVVRTYSMLTGPEWRTRPSWETR